MINDDKIKELLNCENLENFEPKSRIEALMKILLEKSSGSSVDIQQVGEGLKYENGVISLDVPSSESEEL